MYLLAAPRTQEPEPDLLEGRGADLAQRLYASNLYGQCAFTLARLGTQAPGYTYISTPLPPGPLRSKTTPLGQVNHRPVFRYQLEYLLGLVKT